MSRTENATPEISMATPGEPDAGLDSIVLAQLTGTDSISPGVLVERRTNEGRRRRSVRSLIRGNKNPRRSMSRRHDDHNLLLLDYYDPKMLYLAMAILLLSCTDALFTLNLMALGAEEMNFFMKVLMDRSVESFVVVKIGLTGVSVVLLVIVAQRRFMGWFRVVRVMQGLCIGYIALITYEIYLFSVAMNW